MKKMAKSMLSVVIVAVGIVWLGSSVEAVSNDSASSLRYCLLDDTYKAMQKGCRNVLEQAKNQSKQQTSEQATAATTNTKDTPSSEPAASEAAITDIRPQPQDGTGYHHGNDQGHGRRKDHTNDHAKGNGLQDGSGAGGQRGRNAGNCLR